MTGNTDQTLLSESDRTRIQRLATGRRGEFSVLWRQSSDIRSAAVTLGLPNGTAIDDHISGRLVWWPNGICDRRLVSIVSSRVQQRRDQLGWWYDLLRTAVLRVDSSDECLFAVDGTVSADVVVRAAELFEIPLLQVSFAERVSSASVAKWLADCRPSSEPSIVERWHATVSPPLDDHSTSRTGIPLRDRLALSAVARCVVLCCRVGGHVHQAIQQRLLETSGQATLISSDERSCPDSLLKELTSLGAVPWIVEGVAPETEWSAAHRTESHNSAHSLLMSPDEWLCHWTRARKGAWPDQPTEDYLDELILGCDTADRSAFAALLRIVEQKLILATTARGGQRAVSFTAVPLQKFRRRRIYRRHKRQYDFEPWGIALRRSVLSSFGARPVVYVSRSTEEDPETKKLLWTQPATDQSGRVSWEEEQEWRVSGDLRLDQLDAESICLFVNAPDEAARIRELIPWPVVVTPASSDELPA